MTALNEIPVSHNKQRCFKPERLNAPRDFVVPSFIKTQHDEGNDHIVADLQPSHPIQPSDPIQTIYQPLIVEIGAGKGMHACLYAKQNPRHNIIAIERTANKFAAFSWLVETLRREGVAIDNLLPVHADAIPYCVYALPPKSVTTFYILYPNPEPKNPNQQWLNMPFFEFLLSRVVDNGKVILVSNIKDYIENAHFESLNTWRLNTKKSVVPVNSKRTHFEIKYLARGETCWELEMNKPIDYITRFDSWTSPNLKSQ